MKHLLLLTILLFTFIACEDQVSTPEIEGRNDAICSKSASDCAPMKWKFDMQSRKIPEYVKVIINKKVVRDECGGNFGQSVMTRIDNTSILVVHRLDWKQTMKTVDFTILKQDSNDSCKESLYFQDNALNISLYSDLGEQVVLGKLP